MPTNGHQSLDLLAEAGRLLLEYNDSAGEIHRALDATAKTVCDEPISIALSYGAIAVSLGCERAQVESVRELRFNMAVQARVHTILDRIRRGELDPAPALAQLNLVEAESPRHSRWSVILMLGASAASLALLLGADWGAALTAGLATGLGLAARQELGRRHFSLLTLPFVAALIGALLGGLTIRLGWTQTPGLALIVPSLILVPGPHFINGFLDLLDNYLPLSMARLGLAMSIVTAAALGTIVGVALTIQEFPPAGEGGGGIELNLLLDMLLAGVVTSGFAAAYNTRWAHLSMAAAGGMVGHGLRFVALENGWNFDMATFLGALGVGIVSAWIARSTKTPVAAIAYAGAVTMMPGLAIYRALGGALQLARLGHAEDSPLVVTTLGHASQACVVAGALALGLVVAVRSVQFLAGVRERHVSTRRT